MRGLSLLLDGRLVLDVGQETVVSNRKVVVVLDELLFSCDQSCTYFVKSSIQSTHRPESLDSHRLHGPSVKPTGREAGMTADYLPAVFSA